MIDERAERAGVAYQFEIQANKLDYQIVKRLTNFRYILKDEVAGNEIQALVIARSFDFYEKHLARILWRIDLLIIQHHNAVLPIQAICLEDSHMYPAGASPATERPVIKHRNHDEALLLISKLILGVECESEMSSLSGRSQGRYLALRNEYLKSKKRGRPPKRSQSCSEEERKGA